MNTINVAVVGATGYTGLELIKLLLCHPRVSLALATSRSMEGVRLDTVHPSLTGLTDASFSAPDAQALRAMDAVFFATPHGASMHSVPELFGHTKIIDLSADFRLQDADTFAAWYGTEHACPSLLKESVYGMSDIVPHEAIREAGIIANPGCYPIATLLGVIPALRSGCIDKDIIIADCKTGASGAGKTLAETNLYCQVNENLTAYKVFAHRHTPEINAYAALHGQKGASVTFTPHLVPMERGILATLYFRKTKTGSLQKYYQDFYADKGGISVLESTQNIHTSSVQRTNNVHIKVCETDKQAIVLVAIDNLMKGASGQALQNFNLCFGCDPNEGLSYGKR